MPAAGSVAMGVMPTAGLLPPMAVMSGGNLAAPALVSQAQMSMASELLAASSGSLPVSAAVVSGGQQQPSQGEQPVMVPGGLLLGDGLMPLPQRLVKRIWELQFVEMYELRPEAWLADSLLEEESSGKCCSLGARRKKTPVTDLCGWLQGYAALVGVLSVRFPHSVPQLMAYQSLIVKAYREFDGLGWVQYDRAFRRQAAITKDLNWSRINTTLYSLCFPGKAKRASVCRHCLSCDHVSDLCPEASVLPFQQLQAALLQLQPPAVQREQAATYTPTDVCRLFNSRDGNKCHFKKCKFAHRCSKCNGAHPRSACPQLWSASGRWDAAKQPKLD